jgi:P4 family phage/plasmid primase-like protien
MISNLLKSTRAISSSPIDDSKEPAERGGIVERLRDLFGRDAVLVPIPLGEKGPRLKGWQQTKLEAMENPAYLRKLARGNIGVLQGAPSNGLCSIDLDSDEAAAAFLEVNPLLKDTLQTRGQRGFNAWVQIEGEYPGPEKIKDAAEQACGEWRSTGNQTVIHGKHPSGCSYRIVNEVPPIKMRFEKILWPKTWAVPWRLSKYDELVREHGEPFQQTENSFRLNQMFLVGKFAAEHLVLFEPDEGQFYLYDEKTGLWRPETDEAIKNQFARDLKEYGDAQGEEEIILRRTNAFLSGLTQLLKGHVQKRNVFKRRQRVIHAANGMVHLETSPIEIHDFSPDYFSRNQCPLEVIDDADCPRFKTELLATALDDDDVSLLQRWLGSVLLGGNSAQRLMMLIGKAGEGKSTLVEIAENVIGEENVTELRTDQLDSRFEMGRFLAKLLLTGKDVPAEFLMRKAASHIKKLVGHDLLSAELKNTNGSFNVRGEFGMAITCNSRLRVLLEGDADAWRRRLLIIEYNKPKPKVRINDFAEKLLGEEGPGILSWMIAGALQHLDELTSTGDFVLTKAQQARVEALLAESDSIREFVRQCLKPKPKAQVTVKEALGGYKAFCMEMGYQPMADHTVSGRIGDLVSEIHDNHKRNDLQDDEGTCRGWKGLQMEGRDA